jgi:hypothetical protein
MTESLRDRIKKIVRDYAAKQAGYAPSLDETVDRIMDEIRKSQHVEPDHNITKRFPLPHSRNKSYQRRIKR